MNSLNEMIKKAQEFLGEQYFSSLSISYQKVDDKDYLKVTRKANKVVISYGQLASLFRGLTLVKEHANKNEYSLEFRKSFDTNCWMIDVSRNAVMKPSQVKKIIMIMALFGLNRLMLYTEDTYQLDKKKYPYFGYLRGAYSVEELQDLDEYASSLGVELVPCIETLDHLGRVLRWDAFNNIQDGPTNINVGEEATYEFIEELIKTCRKCYKSNIIHVGMDESMNLGLGKYLLKNPQIPNRMELFNKHLQRVIDICKKYGFRPIIWSDMFFRLIDPNGNYYTDKKLTPEIIDMIPKDVDLVYWDYYHDDRKTYEVMLKKHQQTHNPISFAGGAWNWATLSPFTKLAKARSITALEVMVENKVKDVMVTTWGDFGAECSNFAALSTLAVFSEFDFLGRHDQAALESLFKAVTGEELSNFHLLDKPNEPEKRIAKVGEYNCGRYYFYQDPLLGLFDSTVKASYKKNYLEYIPQLEKAIKDSPNYAYLYQYTYDLLNVLVDKVDLGVNLRKYYKENNLEKLKEIKDVVLPRLMENIAKFEVSSEYRWRKENRSFGYEVIDGRIGFLKNRLNTTYRLLDEYLSKKIDRIEELEAELLPYSSKVPDDEFGVAPWIYNVSPCEV